LQVAVHFTSLNTGCRRFYYVRVFTVQEWPAEVEQLLYQIGRLAHRDDQPVFHIIFTFLFLWPKFFSIFKSPSPLIFIPFRKKLYIISNNFWNGIRNMTIGPTLLYNIGAVHWREKKPLTSGGCLRYTVKKPSNFWMTLGGKPPSCLKNKTEMSSFFVYLPMCFFPTVIER